MEIDRCVLGKKVKHVDRIILGRKTKRNPLLCKQMPSTELWIFSQTSLTQREVWMQIPYVLLTVLQKTNTPLYILLKWLSSELNSLIHFTAAETGGSGWWFMQCKINIEGKCSFNLFPMRLSSPSITLKRSTFIISSLVVVSQKCFGVHEWCN